MSEQKGNSGKNLQAPIRFVDKLAGSDAFGLLFQDGMALVEETAAYLDGLGRDESKSLNRPGSLAYATESMRLTTRLMQIASWLLLQRAVNEGEMSPEQAGAEKSKVRLDKLSSAREGAGWVDLPNRLQDLIERSIRLQHRVRHIDENLHGSDGTEPGKHTNPVGVQHDLLNAAFDRKSSDDQ